MDLPTLKKRVEKWLYSKYSETADIRQVAINYRIFGPGDETEARLDITFRHPYFDSSDFL